MSKIQKALQILQNGTSRTAKRPIRQSPSGNDADDIDDSGRPTDAQLNPPGNNGGQYLPNLYDADEQLPGFSLKVSVESLIEQGIKPHGADLELVNQQFRRIKRPVLNIAFGAGMQDGKNPNVIMVASAAPRSGKTFCSFNLAFSIAREKDVGAVLVDADVLKPNISRALNLEQRVGLIDYLIDDSISIDDILVGTDLHGIIVVPAGRQHEDATELLASRRMAKFVETLSERYSSRAIIVDTPPLLITNEAQVLAEHMGQIVLIIEAGRSDFDSVTQALDTLNRSKPINAIMNKAGGKSFGDYGAYGYYGGSPEGQGDE